MALCLSLLGCSLRPSVTDNYVIVQAGSPIRVLDTKDRKHKPVSVYGSLMEDESKKAQQDITGWVCMPPDHWDVIKRMLEKNAQK